MIRTVSTALLLALFAGAALASPITLTVTGTDSSRGQNITFLQDNVSTQTFAGGIVINLKEENAIFSRVTFCVDLFTHISVGGVYSTQVLRPDEAEVANIRRVAWLVNNALRPSGQSGSLQRVTNASQGAGLQLAIWDIIHDNGNGFGTNGGRIRFAGNTNSSVRTWANYYLSQSTNRSSMTAFVYDNVQLSNNVPAQDLVSRWYNDGGPMPTPEPATMLLTTAGLAGIIFAGKRFSKNREE